MAKTKVAQKELDHLRRCLNNLEFYSKEHLIIVPKVGPLRKLTFNNAQRIIQKKTTEQRKQKGFVKVICLKARQEGISTWTAARFFRGVNFIPYRKVAVIADQKDKASNLFGMYERFYKFLDESIKPQKVSNPKGQLLELENGSAIVVDTAGDQEAQRSATLHYLHASEIAFWPNAETVWTSLAQTVPDAGGEIIIESTANGVGNFFHREWERAKAGESDFIPVFLPWWIHEEYVHPVTKQERQEILLSSDAFERQAQDEGFEWEGDMHKLSVEQLMWRRKTIQNKLAGDERKFRQEYPTTDREAFLVSGACFFDEEALVEHEALQIEAHTIREKARGTLRRSDGTISVISQERGHLRIWELPKSNRVYVIGADTAKGVTVSSSHISSDDENERGGRDFSSADVFDVQSRKQVAQLHGRLHPDEFARQLEMLGYLYGNTGPEEIIFPATIAVERNHSSGETVIRKLQTEFSYPALYYGKLMNHKRTGRPTSQVGWTTTKANRQMMLDELEWNVRDKTIFIACPQTIKEMFTFVRGDDGIPRAQEGSHDDRVMSLAITLQAARTAPHSTPDENIQEPETFEDSPTGLVDYGWDEE